ncbi:MAG TPA: IS200/IS605 family transposase [Pyrinomonadaceae bacterium]|jgi:Transposase and inactivated derivatives|nr:IS200/IS605 family transposase [Pyrinomonadaceae bacterium]
MNLTVFTSLVWAYQLHYYLCFRTHRRRQIFRSREQSLKALITEICERHEYHLLECQPHAALLRCLVSLRPDQAVAKTIQTLKTNASREWSKQWSLDTPVWARGYLARSVGKVRIDAVRRYLEQQGAHHGYDSRVVPPVYRYRDSKPGTLATAHSNFELNHHLVLATCRRKGIFGASLGKALSEYWLRVASKHRFAIDQISVVPDHIHLIVRIVPSMSIQECALLLMNNGQYFVWKNYSQELIKAGIDQLWQASAYAGTCGEYTSALIKKWLNSPE